jgi:hypothetical protein
MTLMDDGTCFVQPHGSNGTNIWLTREAMSTNILLEELRPGSRYEARVHIHCTSEIPQYASVSFETNLYDEPVIAPNPTDDKIAIRPSKNLIGKGFNIYDNAGRMLFSGQLLEYTIDLTNFAPGLYILKIDGENIFRVVKY